MASYQNMLTMVYVGVWTATISSAWAFLISSSTDHLVQLIGSQGVGWISDFEDLIATIWENIGTWMVLYIETL